MALHRSTAKSAAAKTSTANAAGQETGEKATVHSGPAELRAENLVRSFGGVKAVRGVDLTLASGHTLAVIGPNGAGKSSLINVLTGLYKPTSGRVLLDGVDISHRSMAARTRMGLMRTFQGNRIFATLRVENALSLGLEAPRARKDVASARDLAAQFNLTDYYSRVVADLPYGIQKILNLALVAASRPRVLLLDEPFAGVHAGDVARLSEVIRRFSDDGVAVAVVEHNIEALLRIADEVVVLDSGSLIFRGSPDEARVSATVREAYLGVGGAA